MVSFSYQYGSLGMIFPEGSPKLELEVVVDIPKEEQEKYDGYSQRPKHLIKMTFYCKEMCGNYKRLKRR